MNYAVALNMQDPYSHQIQQFITQEFPTAFKCTHNNRLDILTEIIVASGQVRYGPRPNPESLVEMRKVIARYMHDGRPIPFLSPWGSEKPNGTGIDIAEMMALKTLLCLQTRVAAHYPPGIEVMLRVEDLSAPHQFYHRADEARKEAALYTQGLINLVRALDFKFVFPTPESSRGVNEAEFNEIADKYVPVFEEVINYRIKFPEFPRNGNNQLDNIGWTGEVSKELVAFYLDSYAKLYPDTTPEEKIHILARYFAGSLARRKTGVANGLPDWGGQYLQIYFGKTPDGKAPPTRLHYRTMPCSITTNHMAPWRAKGYFLIEEDEITAKLASFREDLAFNPFTFDITSSDGNAKQTVQADYVIGK
jgi:hypothetical protein